MQLTCGEIFNFIANFHKSVTL